MMETREHSASHTLTAARRISSIFLARTRPDTVASLMTVSGDCRFDQCALLRWADERRALGRREQRHSLWRAHMTEQSTRQAPRWPATAMLSVGIVERSPFVAPMKWQRACGGPSIICLAARASCVASLTIGPLAFLRRPARYRGCDNGIAP
jgi:hypothetical protein